MKKVMKRNTRSCDFSITFYIERLYDSNKSPTRCNNFPVYYSDVYLQLNMFRAFSRSSSGAQWLQWQPLVLPLIVVTVVLCSWSGRPPLPRSLSLK